MTSIQPAQEWWTAAEIAEAGLPDMPDTRQGVDAYIKRADWRAHPTQARRRAARGGGWEYHWKLFPSRAQGKLIKLAGAQGHAPQVQSAPAATRADAWAWFDGLPESVKDKAKKRLRILQEVEELAPAVTKFTAVNMIAKAHHVSERTVWNWFDMVDGIEPADWLAYLPPRHRAAPPKGMQAVASPKFYAWLKADYLRLEGPSFRKSHREAVRLSKAHGLDYLSCCRTAERWMNRNVPRVQQVFLREGVSGLMKCYPPQIRDRSQMTAMEGVNADCHKIDVFVIWPGFKKPIRPQIVAFQDIYSGKILSWRVDVNPNKVAVMSAFMELIGDWGIPQHCLFDNGMEFANKWLSGGAQARFRFKIREDGEPLGVLAMLGIKVHFAKPAHGQAKPIERAFGDFARDIAKDARFAGAYVGHRPDAKPENYMSRAVELEDFLRVVTEGVAEHNARIGRSSHTAQGRSFDETFAESYARHPIQKATEEQMRLCLMAQELRQLHKHHGQMTIHKNGYWSEWMSELAGQTVVARFNPENLHEGAYIYSTDGEYLGFAECRKKSAFFDLASAQADARRRSRYLRQQRKAAKETLPISVGGLAADLDRLPQRVEAKPEAKVVKLAQLAELEQRGKGGLLRRPLPAPDPALDEQIESVVLTGDFSKPRSRKAAPEPSSADLFWRALSVEQRLEAGQDISAEDAEFYSRIRRLPEYQAQRTIYEKFGAAGIA